MDNKSYKSFSVTSSCSPNSDIQCECPANRFYLEYRNKLKDYLDRRYQEPGDVAFYEDFQTDLQPNYVMEIIKEETVTEVQHKSGVKTDKSAVVSKLHDKSTVATEKKRTTQTQSVIEMCKELLEPKREGKYDFLEKIFKKCVEDAMEFSDSRIDTCSCIFRDDSDAYICGTKKDETEQVCVAILTGQRSTCSSTSGEPKTLDGASQDVICTCRICVCDGVAEEEQTMETVYPFMDELGEEEEVKSELDLIGGEEEHGVIEEVWKSKSMKMAEEYLKNHKIKELFYYMISSLLTHNPDNPIQYLVNILDRCILYRQKQIGPPLLFSRKHIESLYNRMDPMQFGQITINQYKIGMFTLGLKYYNPYPIVDDNGKILKEVFIDEAMKCMQLCFDELIKIRKSDRISYKDLSTLSTLSSDTCRCNVSLIS